MTNQDLTQYGEDLNIGDPVYDSGIPQLGIGIITMVEPHNPEEHYTVQIEWMTGDRVWYTQDMAEGYRNEYYYMSNLNA